MLTVTGNKKRIKELPNKRRNENTIGLQNNKWKSVQKNYKGEMKITNYADKLYIFPEKFNNKNIKEQFRKYSEYKCKRKDKSIYNKNTISDKNKSMLISFNKLSKFN